LSHKWLLQLPLAYILSRHTALGEDGLWWSMPVANIGAAGLAAAWFLKGDWKKRRLVPQTPMQVQQEQVEEQAQF